MARRLFPYSRFVGLDTVTSPTNMSERYFVDLQDAYIDFRGQIVKGPGTNKDSSNTQKHFISSTMALTKLSGTLEMAPQLREEPPVRAATQLCLRKMHQQHLAH